jgi:hypothetical protein
MYRLAEQRQRFNEKGPDWIESGPFSVGQRGPADEWSAVS